jgi:hypothetical protein
VMGPRSLPLLGQQALKQASAPQPIPKAATSTVPGGSDSDRFATTVTEVVVVVVATVAKKDADATVVKEAAVAKKAAEEATTAKAAEEPAAVKKAMEEVMAAKAVEEAMTKATEEAMTMTLKAADEATAVAGPNDSGGSNPDVMQPNAKGAPDTMLDPKLVGKRPAAMIGSGGSSPPPPISTFTAFGGMTCIYCNFFLFPSQSLPRFLDPCSYVVGCQTQT